MTTTAMTKATPGGALPQTDEDLLQVLGSSLYPGADPASIRMVLGYCRAAGLDPMAKPVHIVPVWDGKAKRMRDVVMPGINSYRVAAARSEQFVGMSEPEFGPLVERDFSPSEGKGAPFRLAFPDWCRVSVRRLVAGQVSEFTSVEYWTENYATAGRDTDAPNAMWRKRPRGQLAKCTQAQALRIAFPELAAPPTAEEMEGKTINADEAIVEITAREVVVVPPDLIAAARAAAADGVASYAAWWKDCTKADRQLLQHEHPALKIKAEEADASKAAKVDPETGEIGDGAETALGDAMGAEAGTP